MRLSRVAADLLLLLVTLIWGSSFIIVRDYVQVIPPLLLIAARFSLAFLALAAIFPRRPRAYLADMRAGLTMAVPLLGGFVLQTFGLRYTSASASGFITGLSVVLVALMAAVMHRRIPSLPTAIGVLLATTGLLLLSWRPDGWHFGLGDLLTLGCAVFFALHIVITGMLAPNRDPVTLSTIQFGAVALACLGLHALIGGGATVPGVAVWIVLAYLGFACTGFAFLVQTVAQRHTTAVDTAIIFAAEPLFAAFFAVLLGGERLTPLMALGGSLIFGATLLAILRPNGRGKPATA